VGSANLIGKVYFPRLIVPGAAIVVALVDFLVSFGVLAAVMAWYRHAPDWRIVTIPFFIALAIAASLGPGLWLTALNVKYRDFRYVVPFVLQLGLYISPVGFSSSVIPERWRLVYSLNPAVAVIDGFRWALLGGEAPLYVPGFLVSCAVIALFLWLGIRQFRRVERGLADLL